MTDFLGHFPNAIEAYQVKKKKQTNSLLSCLSSLVVDVLLNAIESRFRGSNHTAKTTEICLLSSKMFQENAKSKAS